MFRKLHISCRTSGEVGTFSIHCYSEQSVRRENRKEELASYSFNQRFFFRFLSFVNGIIIPLRLSWLKPRRYRSLKLPPHSVNL